MYAATFGIMLGTNSKQNFKMLKLTMNYYRVKLLSLAMPNAFYASSSKLRLASREGGNGTHLTPTANISK